VCRDGRAWWVEVKYKDSPAKYQIAGEHRHGIDLPNWDAYREVERESGVPGWLAIVQARAGKAPEVPFDPVLLTASFAYLATRAQRDPRPFDFAPRGMVWWAVDAFEHHAIDFTRPPALGAKTVHAWDGRGARWEPNPQRVFWPGPSFPCRKKPES